MYKKLFFLICIFFITTLCYSEVQLLNDSDFYQETKGKTYIIDFYADWRSSCRNFAPVFERMAKKLKGYNFALLNTENSPIVTSDFNIVSIPFIAAVKDGKLLEQYKGDRSESDFYNWCSNIFGVTYSLRDRNSDNNTGNKEEIFTSLENLDNIILERDIKKFKSLFENKELSINSKDKNGFKPIHYAAMHDATEGLIFIKYLAQIGADVNDIVYLKNPSEESYWRREETPIFFSIKSNNLEAVKYFLNEKKVDLKHQSYSSFLTAMDTACISGNFEIVKLLFPLLENKTITGAYPHLFWAIMYNKTDISKYLIDNGVDINWIKYDTDNVLICALRYNLPEIAYTLINMGADINVRGHLHTPLAVSASLGNFTMMKYLFDRGAEKSININDNLCSEETGKTALHQAAEYNSPYCASLLMSYNINTELKEYYGKTALDIALEKGYYEVVEVIKGNKKYNLPEMTIEEDLALGVTAWNRGAPGVFPDFYDSNDKTISLKALKGKVIFFHIWNSNYDHEEMVEMNSLYNKLNKNKFEMIAISANNDKESVKKYLSDNKFNYKTGFNSPQNELDKAGFYNGYYPLPMSYIIDKNGIQIYMIQGSRKWSEDKYVKFFEKLMKLED